MSQLARLVLAAVLEMGLMGETLHFPLSLPLVAAFLVPQTLPKKLATLAALVVVVVVIARPGRGMLAALEQQGKALRVVAVLIALRQPVKAAAAAAELEVLVQTLLPRLAAMAEQARLLLSLAAQRITLAAAAVVQRPLQALQD